MGRTADKNTEPQGELASGIAQSATISVQNRELFRQF